MLHRITARGCRGTSSASLNSGSSLVSSEQTKLHPASLARLHGSAHSAKRFDRNARKSKPKAVAGWKSRERELRSSITQLEGKLDHLHKQQRAEEATKHLPDLDEAVLDEIYQGVKEGDPIPPSEMRLLESQEQKSIDRHARVLQQYRQQLPLPAGAVSGEGDQRPLTFSEKVKQRLEVFSARLALAEQRLESHGAASSSRASQEISQLRSDAEGVRAQVELLEREDSEPGESREAEDAEEDTHKDFETVSLHSDRSPPGSVASVDVSSTAPDTTSTHVSPTSANAEELVARLSNLIKRSEGSRHEKSPILTAVKAGEWVALGQQVARHGKDALIAQTFGMVDSLLDNTAIEPSSVVAFYEAIADVFAEGGRSAQCEAIVAKLIQKDLQVTSYAYHALTKSYLRDSTKGPSTALQLLNHLENSPTPASEATYSLVLSSLLDQPSVDVMDQAWGVWYRMRLNAHPTPDAVTWSKMIRACALGSTPSRGMELRFLEAHRGGRREGDRPSHLSAKSMRVGQSEVAMDLFREMTSVHGIRPIPACYDNLILTLCRGAHGRYLEGFNLLREMIALAEETKVASYEPTKATFNALLEGCRRHADLLRSRWVLAEMIRSSAPIWDGRSDSLSWKDKAKLESRMPDAESLGKLFLTYAAWTPPKVPLTKHSATAQPMPSATPASADKASRKGAQIDEAREITEAQPANAGRQDSVAQPAVDEAAAEFSSTPPSTSAEVVRELRGLFARAIADRLPNEASPLIGPFSRVHLSTRLANAYLNALIAHLPGDRKIEALNSALRGHDSLFANLGLVPNGRTYLQVLSTCFSESNAGPRDRDAQARHSASIGELASWAWSSWRALETEADRLPGGRRDKNLGTDRVTRELVWAERVRLLAKRYQLDEAMDTLREFAALYPPAATIPASSSPGFLATAERKMPFFDASAAIRALTFAEVDAFVPNASASLPAPSATGDRSLQNGSLGAPAVVERRLGGARTQHAAKPWLDDFGNPSERPPSLSFLALNLLHQRLIEAGDRREDVAYLGWLCKTWDAIESKKLASKRARQQQVMSRKANGPGGRKGADTTTASASTPAQVYDDTVPQAQAAARASVASS
ncbi:unnamed protein product [Parajaminaea phylloscopi]